ncbi:hypothetical protein MK805_06365 [Shimazuella sp. AN120528]|uniref:hypothetical protein n=1 Tax=Shimazuella soli TaxID=1892854 RepID=UPI001F0EEAD4|nr:hypothetical protein [Shimazuella soli]MCH5584592.1 hypothetical protein [Shimazuella soli]
MKKRTPLDIVVLGIVVVIALIVIALSFQNTTKLSGGLGLNPYLTAGLVEILFASLLLYEEDNELYNEMSQFS